MLHIIITPTCFNASASSSEILNVVLIEVTKLLKLKLPAYKKNKYRIVQSVYAATKQQLTHFSMIL
jgi:hypothetical protein